uniref:Proteasome activator complex subunit 2 n=1 Tax=Callorhinchus milii TaxID=7868 RepID=V9LB10_CALMI
MSRHLKIKREYREKIEEFRGQILERADILISTTFPNKITELNKILKEESLNVLDLTLIHSPLVIPIPDPPKKEENGGKNDSDEGNETKKEKAPKCGFIASNEKILTLLNKLKPELRTLRENITLLTIWIQYLVPQIEDGNDFGVAIQEKVLERIAAVKTKVETYQTNINKYFSERGDAVGKASKDTHVMDYRQLVHEKDEAIYIEIRTMLMDIRGYYGELADIIVKNTEKITMPKGDVKPAMY